MVDAGKARAYNDIPLGDPEGLRKADVDKSPATRPVT
jgi:hypothetical protein